MCECQLTLEGDTFTFSPSEGMDLSIPVDFEKPRVSAFGMRDPESTTVTQNGFVGSTARGGPVNCKRLHVIPHANGTHTESVAHIVDRAVPVSELLPRSPTPVGLISATPERLEDVSDTYCGQCQRSDRVIAKSSVQSAWERLPLDKSLEGLIIRTSLDRDSEIPRDYGETNPPYFTSNAIRYIKQLDIDHLIVDLPSIDREKDGGDVPNHHLFWGVDGDGAVTYPERTVTELIRVGYSPDDGIFALNLQGPNMRTDAIPTRPILHQLNAAD